jgi:hypothetical protein
MAEWFVEEIRTYFQDNPVNFPKFNPKCVQRFNEMQYEGVTQYVITMVLSDETVFSFTHRDAIQLRIVDAQKIPAHDINPESKIPGYITFNTDKTQYPTPFDMSTFLKVHFPLTDYVTAGTDKKQKQNEAKMAIISSIETAVFGARDSIDSLIDIIINETRRNEARASDTNLITRKEFSEYLTNSLDTELKAAVSRRIHTSGLKACFKPSKDTEQLYTIVNRLDNLRLI